MDHDKYTLTNTADDLDHQTHARRMHICIHALSCLGLALGGCLGFALGGCQSDTPATVGSNHAPATVTATQSGAFTDPATWGGAVPGSSDDVVISGGVTVSADAVQAASLTVDSGGALHAANNIMLTIDVATVTVASGGEIRSSGTADIYFGGLGGQLYLDNQGVIAAGGDLTVNGGFGSDAPTSTTTAVYASGGVFSAGSPDGSIYIVAYLIDLDNAVVQAGSGAVPANWLNESRAGNVYIGGALIDIGGTTAITSGDNTTPSGTGGGVDIIAFQHGSNTGHLVIGSSASVQGGSPTVGGCPGISVFAATSSTIQGMVGPQSGGGCTYWDPPTLTLAGTPTIRDDVLMIAAETLDARWLQPAAHPAVDAGTALHLYFKPNGTFDLRGLQPGHDYFRADQITIHGSSLSIRTTPGTSAADFMSPAPLLDQTDSWPAEFAMIHLTDGIDVVAAPGDTRELPLMVTNISPHANLDISIEYTNSQNTSVNETWTDVPPGGIVKLLRSITAPAAAQPDSCITYRVDVTAEDQANSAPSTLASTNGRVCAASSIVSNDACQSRPDQPGDRSFCTEDCPCDAGEGDCDGDTEQCAPGLTCVHNVGANYGWDADIDVCEDTCHPSAVGSRNFCTDDCPCDEGEGDCDGDTEQCAPGLTCVHNVGANYGWSADIDVCEQL